MRTITANAVNKLRPAEIARMLNDGYRAIHNLTAKIELIETCNVHNVKEIEKFKHDITDLKASKAGLEMQLSNKKSEVIKLEAKNNELIKQVGDIHSNKYHLEQDLAAATQRNELLESDLNFSNIKIHQLEASIKELRWVVKRK